ncbi:N-formylglutamate amidohydrolase [Alphaproteobacteria bacterium]|jgi:N-formylglutamate amidohydrolase|nr:N-formylglutamate amidohydrolase [Alphaproteobacteria bacterium]
MIEVYSNNSIPIIISIPHSGTLYSNIFLKNILLSKKELQFSEDNYVDKVLEKVLSQDVSYVKANFPRSFIDVNRSPLELDSLMVSSNIPIIDEFNLTKVKSGIGVIHRVSYYGNEIYDHLLTRREIVKRLLNNYFPYHNALKLLIKNAKKINNRVLVLDFHSMPSRFLDNSVDIVIGNNFNLSCNETISTKIINYFYDYNYSLSINDPYSGGFITKFYGKPMDRINILQIEINRSLYMNEDTLEIKSNKLNVLSKNLNSIIKKLTNDI